MQLCCEVQNRQRNPSMHFVFSPEATYYTQQIVLRWGCIWGALGSSGRTISQQVENITGNTLNLLRAKYNPQGSHMLPKWCLTVALLWAPMRDRKITKHNLMPTSIFRVTWFNPAKSKLAGPFSADENSVYLICNIFTKVKTICLRLWSYFFHWTAILRVISAFVVQSVIGV